MIFQQVIADDFTPKDTTETGISRVTGIGNKHLITGITKCQGNMQDAFLGTDKGLNFTGRIELYLKPPSVPGSHGLFEWQDACCGLITMGRRLTDLPAKGIYGLRRGRHIRTTYCQTDDILSGFIKTGYFLDFSAEIVLTYLCQTGGWTQGNIIGRFHILLIF